MTKKKQFKPNEQSVNNLGKAPTPGAASKKKRKKKQSRASKVLKLLDKTNND